MTAELPDWHLFVVMTWLFEEGFFQTPTVTNHNLICHKPNKIYYALFLYPPEMCQFGGTVWEARGRPRGVVWIHWSSEDGAGKEGSWAGTRSVHQSLLSGWRLILSVYQRCQLLFNSPGFSNGGTEGRNRGGIQRAVGWIW